MRLVRYFGHTEYSYAMRRQLLINIPVSDPKKSKRFFEEVGFSLNKELTDEQATCFDIDDNIKIALLPIDHFMSAINNHEVADTSKCNEVLLSIGVTGREEVDIIMTKAIAAGGNKLSEPTDYGSIYGATFADPDGHQWNIYYMEPTKNLPKRP
ncbi:MAG: hypothetical protein JWM56_752 [Candidatus Peribacteria bacterium]|nr:hypothetical protein [Candidatus Peribacteria bacterium]